MKNNNLREERLTKAMKEVSNLQLVEAFEKYVIEKQKEKSLGYEICLLEILKRLNHTEEKK